jgi:RimJ/RimL family protein N-acetyltransferase
MDVKKGTGYMRFQALLYVESEIAEEEHFLNWMKTEAKDRGIRCIDIASCTAKESPENARPEDGKSGGSVPVTIGQVREAVRRNGVSVEDCLYIVTGEEEWALAKQLNLAALPYVPATESGASKPCFDSAWMIVEGFAEADGDFLNKCYQRARNLPWEILATERCLLRELTMDDMDDLFRLYEQPGVTDFMEGLYEREEEERYEQAYIEQMYRYYGYGMWLVIKKDTGEVIGRAGLEHRDYHGETELEMGYLIAPSEQRKGYAAEICRALIAYARDNLDFSRVNCLIHRDNLVSKHLAERLGFTFFEKIIENGVEMDRYTYCFFEKNRL